MNMAPDDYSSGALFMGRENHRGGARGWRHLLRAVGGLWGDTEPVAIWLREDQRISADEEDG